MYDLCMHENEQNIDKIHDWVRSPQMMNIYRDLDLNDGGCEKKSRSCKNYGNLVNSKEGGREKCNGGVTVFEARGSEHRLKGLWHTKWCGSVECF